jgi:hypothetical protein
MVMLRALCWGGGVEQPRVLSSILSQISLCSLKVQSVKFEIVNPIRNLHHTYLILINCLKTQKILELLNLRTF